MNLVIIPYSATALSIIARFIFMFLLYKNKSTNTLSLAFSLLSLCSSGMWIYYSIRIGDVPILLRSCAETSLLSISAIYIVRNKYLQYRLESSTLPIQ